VTEVKQFMSLLVDEFINYRDRSQAIDMTTALIEFDFPASGVMSHVVFQLACNNIPTIFLGSMNHNVATYLPLRLLIEEVR